MPSLMQMLRRLFLPPESPGGGSAEPAPHGDRFARFRPRPTLFSRASASVPEPVDVSAAPRSKLDEDAYLLWQETEFFGERPPHDLGETAQRPIGPHLWVVAGVAWLFTIDPVFRALTPRHFAGIPAPQLLAVLFVFPVLLVALMGFWARGLGPRARVFVRTQALHWKRWLGVALALLWARSTLG